MRNKIIDSENKYLRITVWALSSLFWFLVLPITILISILIYGIPETYKAVVELPQSIKNSFYLYYYGRKEWYEKQWEYFNK